MVKNLVVLITGATGGIGSAAAGKFAEDGYKVILAGRRPCELRAVRERIGGETAAMEWDVDDTDGIAAKTDEAVSVFGKLDVVVNCAGYLSDSCRKNDFFAVKQEEWDAVLNTNLKSMFFICQSVLRYMIDNKIQGHIVNVCSEMGFRPVWYPYGISKWGVRSLTYGLGKIMAPYGITVNGVAPGQTATQMMRYQQGAPLEETSIPRGRMARPEEIAEVIRFLSSEEARNIMGEIVISDGARHLY